MLESTEINEKKAEFDMELTVKISTKLSVYLHNYYDSYLSLIFECFNIVVIFVYLLSKLLVLVLIMITSPKLKARTRLMRSF